MSSHGSQVKSTNTANCLESPGMNPWKASGNVRTVCRFLRSGGRSFEAPALGKSTSVLAILRILRMPEAMQQKNQPVEVGHQGISKSHFSQIVTKQCIAIFHVLHVFTAKRVSHPNFSSESLFLSKKALTSQILF